MVWKLRVLENSKKLLTVYREGRVNNWPGVRELIILKCACRQILEKSLRLLFESRDVSLVKRFVTRQFGKVLSGRVSVQELTFAREYRGAAGYRPTACVPALELAKSVYNILNDSQYAHNISVLIY